MNAVIIVNNKDYSLTLHNLNIWTHKAELEQDEIILFIKEIFKNNPEIEKEVNNAEKV